MAMKPSPRNRNDRRAPTRPTKKPAQVLTVTTSKRPIQIWGVCNGVSPRATLTTKADWTESIRPARQTAHAATPASKASPSETNSDFQLNVFKSDFLAEGGEGRASREDANALKDYTPASIVLRKRKESQKSRCFRGIVGLPGYFGRFNTA